MTGQEVMLSFKPRALLTQHFDQRVQRLEPGVGDGGIGQRPQMLGGLQFRRIGWEGDPLETSGSPFVVTDVEAPPSRPPPHGGLDLHSHSVRTSS